MHPPQLCTVGDKCLHGHSVYSICRYNSNVSSKRSLPHTRQAAAIRCAATVKAGGRNNRVRIQKYAKSCCHKTTCMGNYFDDPNPLTGTLRCACIYIAARRLDYCNKRRFFLKLERAAIVAVYITLCLCSLELNFSLFCDILGSGLDHNVFREIRAG